MRHKQVEPGLNIPEEEQQVSHPGTYPPEDTSVLQQQL